MGIKGHGAAMAGFALLSLGLGGCVQTQDNSMPLDQPATSGCPHCQAARMAAAASDGAITTAAYRPLHEAEPGGRDAIVKAGYQPIGDSLSLGKPIDSPPLGRTCCPREIAMVSHPPYTVAPPDVLLIDVIRAVPRGPYRLEPLEALQIAVGETLPNQPITGAFMISTEGNINLGYAYGSVHVGGMTLEEAESAVRTHLSKVLKAPMVAVSLNQMRGIQQISGQHPVRPDGTIGLGSCGSVYVAGFTLEQLKCELERFLSAYLVNPQVSVDVVSYNSKKYYVIFDGAGFGQCVIPQTVTGNETVLDAIGRVGGLAPVSSTCKMVLARPSPVELGCNQIMPVDWKAVLMGSTATNYEIFPGDRIYVYADPWIEADNCLAKWFAPVERVMGFFLLTNTAWQGLRNNTFGNGACLVPPR
jgi:polysaccharide export outer membrane protein